MEAYASAIARATNEVVAVKREGAVAAQRVYEAWRLEAEASRVAANVMPILPSDEAWWPCGKILGEANRQANDITRHRICALCGVLPVMSLRGGQQ